MAMPTLLDIAVKNGSDPLVGLIDETTQATPEVRNGFARTIKGEFFKTLVRLANPTVGFRAANAGAAASKGTYENRLVQSYILDARWECDKAVADRDEFGADAFIAMEAGGTMEATFQRLASQFYYGGTSLGDPLGNPGLLLAYDTTNMVIDAAGTTAGTGSSVWAVKWGPRDVSWIYGSNGEMKLPAVAEQRVLDANGNPYQAYCQNLLMYPGLQVASIRSIARIKKLTKDNGCTLTDNMIYDLLNLFPTGTKPDCLLMNRRSLGQLRKSRTATNETGKPAPTPVEVDDIPIWTTDAILNTEALTL